MWALFRIDWCWRLLNKSCTGMVPLRSYTKFEVSEAARPRATGLQSFDLIANRGQNLRSSNRGQIKILFWNLHMLIPKWHCKSKSDQNCGFFMEKEVWISNSLKNTFLLIIKSLIFHPILTCYTVLESAIASFIIRFSFEADLTTFNFDLYLLWGHNFGGRVIGCGWSQRPHIWYVTS